MRREITYRIQAEDLPEGRLLTANEFFRTRGYSRHLMTYLRHHEKTLLLNGEPVFTNRPLQAGDRLTAIFTDPAAEEDGRQAGSDAGAFGRADGGTGRVPLHIVPNRMDLDIVYEDEDLLVVNKPPYLPVQPSLGHREQTLGNGVVAYYEDQGLSFIYRCVNRIDKNTSGLVLIAKNMASSAILYDAMKRREIHRTYLAIVQGQMPEAEGVIDLPIARSPGSTIMRAVDAERGKRAVTHYRVLSEDQDRDLSALQVVLETGRTHQIRVHMAALGHPLAGDGMYNQETSCRKYIGRQALHSVSLALIHPISRQPLSFFCPPPADMTDLFGDDILAAIGPRI